MNVSLKDQLDSLYRTFDRRFLSPDPLEVVHRYRRPKDREVVGFLASALAYGHVDQILKSLHWALALMQKGGARPYEFVMGFSPRRDARKFSGFYHRFNRGEDLACLIYYLQQAIGEAGSLGQFFLRGYWPKEPTVGPALSRFVQNLLSLDRGPFYRNGKRKLPPGVGVRYFLPSPESGSACKRLNLFLRWMVRREDGLDFGQWKTVSPAKLIIPLDVHVARVSRHLGLTDLKSPSWRMAEDVTATLRSFDPDDPVKYDFALFRLGALGQFPR